MFLEISGLPFKRIRFKKHSFFNGPVKSEAAGNQKPTHLVPLGEAMWPKEVIEKITQLFKAIDLQDPGRQKLVEPYAVAFGGKNIEGMADYSSVNWDKLVDYFIWEAAEHDENPTLAEELQQKALAKYGKMFMHYPVYEEYSGWR